MTEEIFQKLKPYICAFNSVETKININSLNPFYPNILVALSSNTLSELEARNILNSKPLGGYSSVTDFLNQQEIKTAFSFRVEWFAGHDLVDQFLQSVAVLG